MPDFALERAIGGVVAGIDEVGRGPWAGPVVAAAAILDPARMAPELYDEITDSKRLSPARRRALFGAIRGCARLGLGAASAREVERLNVLGATLLAMTRAVAALKIVPDAALVDGPHVPDLPCPARAVIGGDGLSLSIAAASIVAKVTRDGIMARLARYHPGFGWERNAGYGTAEHRRALDRLGVTPHHRRTFAPIINILSQP